MKRAIACAVGGLLSIAVTSLACDSGGNTTPEETFRQITGRALPEGVSATAHASQVSDNFFHTTHYWLLSGSPDRLRAVTEKSGFVRSDEDAAWAVPDMHSLFGVDLSRGDIIEGYEWELPRDRWYVIFAGEHTALYAH